MSGKGKGIYSHTHHTHLLTHQCVKERCGTLVVLCGGANGPHLVCQFALAGDEV